MSLKQSTLVAGFVLGVAVLLTASTPERAQGISMHMLPKSVAELSGGKWGLTVARSNLLKVKSGPEVIKTAAEFLDFVRKQDLSVQENGVWIVTTNPNAYSDSEKTFLEQVKALCMKEKILLFVARASELPDGWKRYE